MERNKDFGFGVAAGIVVTLVFLGIAVVGVAYTGMYNIAATEDHASFVRWAFETTFRNSVEHRAERVTPPEVTADMIEAGASKHRETCEHCHGGPGVEQTDWAHGMRPMPPHLVEVAPEWSTAEVFWLAKHGARMTGMPAFGPTHDEQALWSVAAFVKELPAMTPERYASFGGSDATQDGHRH